MKLLIIFLSLFSMGFSSQASMIDESGPGNGTDYVKVLFAEAHANLRSATKIFSDGQIALSELEEDLKTWLLESNGDGTRWKILVQTIEKLELRYQREPCTDFTKKPASICYFIQDESAYVLISLQENRLTTHSLAMAMLLHEAGHVLGEKNHLFLDRLGVGLVNVLFKSIIVRAQVRNIPIRIDDVQEGEHICKNGVTGIKNILYGKIKSQCHGQGLICDLKKIVYSFSVSSHSKLELGRGKYDVYCDGEAHLPISL